MGDGLPTGYSNPVLEMASTAELLLFPSEMVLAELSASLALVLQFAEGEAPAEMSSGSLETLLFFFCSALLSPTKGMSQQVKIFTQDPCEKEIYLGKEESGKSGLPLPGRESITRNSIGGGAYTELLRGRVFPGGWLVFPAR